MTKKFDYTKPFAVRDGRRAKLLARASADDVTPDEENLAVLIFPVSGDGARIYSYYENGSYFDANGSRVDDTDLVNLIAKTADYRSFNEHAVSVYKHLDLAAAIDCADKSAARGVLKFLYEDGEYVGVELVHTF